MFIEGVDGSEYGRFCFSPRYDNNFESVWAVDLEYGYSTESSPPVDIWDNHLLYKEDVRRLINYLTKLEEKM